ncbi:hypothetical protein Q9323_15010 [Pseudomonas fulva]|uniref:hypothetical protein n=1 Tax=Pseudomonas fulva TaxID=47880 RepID=UPI000CE96B71|nr:hypothetical protein [Pseudomonas fulva]AVF56256.1 hypothetical protein AL527_14400 [Pseudomonas fulva]
MTTPANQAGENPVDQKSWPFKWQIMMHVLSILASILIATIPNCKPSDSGEEKDKGIYTKAEVRQMIDTAVLNSRYAQTAEVDDLYNWTQNSFQYNSLPTLPRPTTFRDRSTPQPGYPQQPQVMHEPVLPPREKVHSKKPP